MRLERDKRGGSLLLLALLACGVLTALHERAAHVGRMDPISGSVRDYGLVPGQVLTTRIGRLWHLSFGSLFAGPRLARANAALSDQVLELSAQNKELAAEQSENVRLHQLLGFAQRSPRPLLAAQVAALKPNAQSDTLILNRGSVQGVSPRSVVLAPGGALVGQVVDVSSRSCDVLLLTDSASSVGALIENRTAHGPIGLCQGSGQGQMRVTYLRSDTLLHVGDAVVSSGLGGVYPKGLAVGTVSSILMDHTHSSQTALLRPTTDFDHLEEVFIMQTPSEPQSVLDGPASLSAPLP
jgi:rod shape-determining protein MreC